MPLGGRDFDAGNDEEAVDRPAVSAHEAFIEKITDAITRVVVGDGKAVQPFLAGRGNILFRAGNAVAGKERMRMQVDIERHWREANLHALKCKASVSRSGPWFARRSDVASSA